MATSTPAINFIGRFRSQIILSAKRHLIIQTVAVAVLIGYGLVVMSVFLYQLHIQQQILKVETSIQKKEEELGSFLDFETKYQLLKYKTKSLMSISQSALHHQRLVEALFRLFPEGLVVDSFTIQEGGAISFSAQTANPVVMNTFIQNLERKTIQDIGKVVSASFGGVSLDSRRDYSMQVTLVLQLNQT